MTFFALVVAGVLLWLYRSVRTATWVGMSGSLNIRGNGHLPCLGPGRLAALGQFHRHTLHDAFLCDRGMRPAVPDRFGPGVPVLAADSGKNFFRVIFFIPLMVTPLGVGYAMKMVADITKGPFEPFLGSSG